MAKYFFTLALMACLALGAAAQDENEGWGTLTLEWNPMTHHYTGKKSHDYYYYDYDYDNNMNGFSIGYTHAFPLSHSVPLFLEPGLLAQFTYHSKSYDDYYYSDYSDKYMMASLKAPVNVLYKFTFPNSSIALMPFAGLTVRGNLWGENKWEEGKESGSVNLFDKKKMGKDDVWKRVQVGWQIGVKARFGQKFIVGGSYGTDFNEICRKYKFRTGTLMVGLIL